RRHRSVVAAHGGDAGADRSLQAGAGERDAIDDDDSAAGASHARGAAASAGAAAGERAAAVERATSERGAGDRHRDDHASDGGARRAHAVVQALVAVDDRRRGGGRRRRRRRRHRADAAAVVPLDASGADLDARDRRSALLMRARAVALAMAAALACKSTTPGAVDLTIIADPSLSDATVAAIGVIDVSVSGAASVAQPYVVSGAFGSGRQERLVIRPPVTSGMLTITVLARSAAGDALAYGQTNVTLQPSRSTSATVTLTGDVPMTDGGAEPPDMTTTGPSLGLVAGHIGGAGYADGPAAVARYNNPRGVVFLGGNLYVADMYNHVIRQIALASGTVSTLAGSALK